MSDLSTMTPVEIDTQIAHLYGAISRAETTAEQAQATIERIDSVRDYDRDLPWNSPAKREAAAAALAQAVATIEQSYAAVRPFEDEFKARPWNRYYLVTNAGGHVHSSMGCQTCFPTTQYAWLVEQSGMTHEALVDLAGEAACTVCFPSAPVDVLRRKSQLETPEAKAKRAEREAAKAEKEATQVTVDGYVGYRGRPQTKVFKTVRGATNDIASHLSSLCWYGTGHPSAQEWQANVDAVRKALAAKGVEHDYDKALVAARKKVKRDGMDVPKF